VRVTRRRDRDRSNVIAGSANCAMLARRPSFAVANGAPQERIGWRRNPCDGQDRSVTDPVEDRYARRFI